jgi:hypothetical protein
MKDISKYIVAKIKEGHIMPESKFKLQWKSYLFWALMFFMILFGALSLSLAIFNVSDIDPRFLQYMELGKFIRLLMITAPYLWIILSLSALFFGIMAFRKTSKGYRHSALFVTSLVVLVISLLGFFGHFLKIDNQMHGMFSKNAPNFKGLTAPREGRWLRPGDGLIGGEIISIGTNEFSIKSFDNKEWKIIYDDKTEKEDLAEITVGEKVGVMGKKNDDFSMNAFSIRTFPEDWNGQPPREPHFSEEKNKHRENIPQIPNFLPAENLSSPIQSNLP